MTAKAITIGGYKMPADLPADLRALEAEAWRHATDAASSLRKLADAARAHDVHFVTNTASDASVSVIVAVRHASYGLDEILGKSNAA